MDEHAAGARIHEGDDLGPGGLAIGPADDDVQVLDVGDHPLERIKPRPVAADARLGVVERLAVVAALVDDAIVGEALDATAGEADGFRREPNPSLFADL